MMSPSHNHQHQPSSAANRRHSAGPQSLDYNIWAEMLLKSNRNTFSRPDTDQNCGPWTRKPPFHFTASADNDKLSQEYSFRQPDYQTAQLGQTNTRAETIERYRHEMMELVRGMPEEEGEEVAGYELSLRDIVDRPAATAEDVADVNRKHVEGSIGGKKRAAGIIAKKLMPRVRAALGGRKRIAGAGGGKGAKVSPKPSNGDCEGRSCSTGSSSDGGGDRRIGGGLGSCYSFLHKHRSKSMQI